MKYTTETGIGYLEDGEGRVVDYYDVPPGEHRAGEPRVAAVDVESHHDLPEIDDEYR